MLHKRHVYRGGSFSFFSSMHWRKNKAFLNELPKLVRTWPLALWVHYETPLAKTDVIHRPPQMRIACQRHARILSNTGQKIIWFVRLQWLSAKWFHQWWIHICSVTLYLFDHLHWKESYEANLQQIQNHLVRVPVKPLAWCVTVEILTFNKSFEERTCVANSIVFFHTSITRLYQWSSPVFTRPLVREANLHDIFVKSKSYDAPARFLFKL